MRPPGSTGSGSYLKKVVIDEEHSRLLEETIKVGRLDMLLGRRCNPITAIVRLSLWTYSSGFVALLFLAGCCFC